MSNWLELIALKVRQSSESNTGRVKFAEAIEELQNLHGKIEHTKAFVCFKNPKALSSVVTANLRYRPSQMQEAISCYITAMVEQKEHQLW